MKISSKRKKYFSKNEIAEFFLFYDKEQIFLFKIFLAFVNLLFFFQNFMFYMYLPFFLFNIVIFLLPYIFIFCIRYKTKIRVEELDITVIEQFIKFFETPGDKRKKSFKHLIEVVEIAKKDYSRRKFNKLRNISSFTLNFYLVLIFVLLVLFYIKTSLFISYSFLWYMLYIFNLALQGFIFLSMFKIFQRLIKYLNMSQSSEIFKTYIDSKLSDFDDVIINLIRAPNYNFKMEIKKLIQDLQNWYSFYCSRFSSNDELNDVLTQFKSLVLDLNVERFYLDLFTDFKGKLNDLNLYNTIQQEIEVQDVQKYQNILEVLENYIYILNHNISTKKERILEAREKRKDWQIVIYITLFPISIVLSVFALIF